MSKMFLVEGGVVTSEMGPSRGIQDKNAIVADLSARIAAMRADPTGAKAAIPYPPGFRFADASTESRERAAAAHRAIAHMEAEVERLTAPETRTLLDADIYTESEIGMPPVWPRAYRNTLLAVTDFVDMAGWRAGKADAVLSAADAYRAALRALPETHPDPADVTFPDKPAGL